jgi:hypothetical protein
VNTTQFYYFTNSILTKLFLSFVSFLQKLTFSNTYVAQTSEGKSVPMRTRIVRARRTPFVAQSGEEDAGQIRTQVKLMTTLEDSEQHDVSNDVPKYGMELMGTSSQVVDLPSFISRSYPVATLQWTSAQSVGTAIPIAGDTTTLYFPGALDAPLKGKMALIQYFRPDVEIEVRVNGTGFHYGRVMVSCYPLPTTLDPVYFNHRNASTFPWYQVNPTANQTVKFVLPFHYYFDKVSTTPNTGEASNANNRQLWGLRFWVMAPLQSANSTTASPVEIVAWARFINPNLSGFTSYPAAFQAQSGEVEKASAGEVITENLTSAVLPVGFNTIRQTVSKIVRMYKNGFSVPPSLQATSPMHLRNVIPGRSCDTTTSVVLSSSQDQKVKSDYNYVNGLPGEDTFVGFCSRPALLYQGQLQPTTNSGKVIWTQILQPRRLLYTDYATSVESGTGWPTPLSYVGNMFKFWRGSVKVHISFVSSKFHSCKLRLSWLPKCGESSVFATDYDLIQTSNMVNVLMDINTQTEYSFVVPYFQDYDYVNNFPADVTNQDHANGQLILQVVNPLASALSTPTPINYQIFISGGEDTQFAYPTLTKVDEQGAPDFDTIPPVPTSSLSTRTGLTMPIIREETELFKAQAGELECQLPSSSYLCLMNTDYMVLGTVGTSYRFDRVDHAFEMTSFKQLATRLSAIEAYTSAAAATPVNFHRTLRPFNPLKREWNDPLWRCYLPYVVAVFRYQRGSTRFAAVSVLGHYIGWRGMLRHTVPSLATNFFTNDTTLPDTSSEGRYDSLGANGWSADPCDITIPYYSNSRCYPTNCTADIAQLEGISAAIQIRTGGNSQSFRLLFGAGDDWMCGMQIGIPRLRYTAAPT